MPGSESVSVSVLFTLDELWLLRSVVRHEIPQQETWHYPPASLDLNEQIALALHTATTYNLTEAPLLLTKGDCLVIDFVVPQEAKTAMGTNLGHPIILKVCAARAELLNGPPPPQLTPEPATLSKWEISQRLSARAKEDPYYGDD